LQQLCQATSALAVENRIVCLSSKIKKKEIIKTPNALVYCYPQALEIASCGFSWALWQDFKQLTEWADVVHYQFPWPFADFLALTRQNTRTPYIVSYQSDIVRQQGLNKLYQPLMNQFLKNSSSVVATSPKYIESSPVLSKLDSPVTLIPNGLSKEPDQISYQKELKEYQQTYGKNFFLFIGVFRYYKGLKYLLQAAKQTELEIVIVGDGPESDELHHYAQENKLKNVHFLGHVNDAQKYALISLTKALVLPASERSEAYGMVLVEAARQGAPMITTELQSGTSYINTNGETGLVVPPKNASELAKAMQYLASNNTALEKMGGLAKERFESNFTANIMGQRYLRVYQQVSA